jgi:7,8-dihydropterin-6-yl-methyl-4-(beta-D-ribofuranosyl)aminobenzene 5'-phosphate synthase
MDCGPEGLSIERNVKAMNVRLQDLDAIVLSHWHRDRMCCSGRTAWLRSLLPDSGGILRALELRKVQAPQAEPLKVDLHPDRPLRRGIAPPPAYIPSACLPEDPTFDGIIARGGAIDLHAEDHEIVGRDGHKSGVGVSGEIKRVTSFEKGLPGAVTWMENENGTGEWFTDEVSLTAIIPYLHRSLTVQLILDERYVVVDVKGKGLVVFSSYVSSL